MYIYIYVYIYIYIGTQIVATQLPKAELLNSYD